MFKQVYIKCMAIHVRFCNIQLHNSRAESTERQVFVNITQHSGAQTNIQLYTLSLQQLFIYLVSDAYI